MTKKILTYTALGLFLVGLIGTVQAGGYNAREDCYTEGPPYNLDLKKGPAGPTRVTLDDGPLYIEGMGFAPRDQGPETIIPNVSDQRDWCLEGYTDDEFRRMMLIKEINKIEPAAGN